MLYTAKQKTHDEMMLDEILTKFQGKCVESQSPILKQCDRILRELIESNKQSIDDDHIDRAWSIILVDDDRFAFDSELVYSDKFIILSKKLIDFCDNQDQIAYLIGHMISHAVLKHYREPISNIKLTDWFKMIVLIHYYNIISSINPLESFESSNILKYFNRFDSNVKHWFFRKFCDFEKQIVFDEALENETDRITLQLLSRACFDIREVEKLIKKFQTTMDQTNKQNSSNDSGSAIDSNRFFMQHGFNELKLKNLTLHLDKFIAFREQCGCKPLLSKKN
ncbi:metalloendopeptidase OMA1-like protein [Sarcoptes scabiei]|uniref:Metalloendopeptidase OMA1, mitochondrial n=1 Tax=Sarcoptes scabiei TaxID=52283 RepID=A0A132AIE4_SARSC|nr:metalloendopeptidase OMA1-like protein [Sarcoptes scabiei]